MKIKHFAGYGTVNAKKISSTTTTDCYGRKLTTLVVEVWGNHERGLVPSITEDAFGWLVVKHFGKNYEEDQLIDIVRNEWDSVLSNGVSEEHCEYGFVIVER